MKIFHDLGVRVDNCAEEVDRRNRKNFLIMSDGALIFAAISFAKETVLSLEQSSTIISSKFLYVDAKTLSIAS